MKDKGIARSLTAASIIFVSLAGGANAALISSSTYSLTAMSGTFSFGRTGWNLGTPVDLTGDTATVGSMLSDGYTDSFSGETPNGIYTFPNAGQLIFEFNGGTDHVLDSLSFISSRAYDSSTTIILDYRLDGGAWQSAVSANTTTLSMFPGLSANNSPGQTFILSFGGVTADAFRLGTASGGQVSFHEVAVQGGAVPEPSSSLLLGLGAMGLMAIRRRKNK